MIIVMLISCAAGSAALLFLNQHKFGAAPSGARLERTKKSPHYAGGSFRNALPTPMMTGGRRAVAKGMLNFFFRGSKRLRPGAPLPAEKHDLLHLPPGEDVVVWFGHSSYFMQLGGKRILVDPVLSGSTGPFPFATKAFAGTDVYTAADIPEIDYLFITHDHWDHLDQPTVVALRSKVKKVICGLGVGAHLELWGYDNNAILEGDWGDKLALDDGFTAAVLPARHFSGRGLKRDQTLWVSFALTTAGGYKVFMGGDGGYGPHFKEIGREFGPFDLAMLEDGQYDPSWNKVHMMPEETLLAAGDLRAARLVPIHNSKFCISNHDWDAPIKAITALARGSGIRLLTPGIGSLLNLRGQLITAKGAI